MEVVDAKELSKLQVSPLEILAPDICRSLTAAMEFVDMLTQGISVTKSQQYTNFEPLGRIGLAERSRTLSGWRSLPFKACVAIVSPPLSARYKSSAVQNLEASASGRHSSVHWQGIVTPILPVCVWPLGRTYAFGGGMDIFGINPQPKRFAFTRSEAIKWRHPTKFI